MEFKLLKFRDHIASQSQVDEVDLLYNSVDVKSTMTSKIIKSHFYSLRFVDEKSNMNKIMSL